MNLKGVEELRVEGEKEMWTTVERGLERRGVELRAEQEVYGSLERFREV